MKLQYLNTAPRMRNAAHGFHLKDLAVLHETVSGDQRGLADIINVEDYLARIGYGIHGMTDAEGNIAWALGMGTAVFYHCGGVNERSIGIEQVFKGAQGTAASAVKDKALWAVRQPELRATAKLLAAWHNADPTHHPLVYSDGRSPGVTSHWDVSQWSPASEGHWDCHPVHKGGYYPILAVIKLANVFAKLGYKF